MIDTEALAKNNNIEATANFVLAQWLVEPNINQLTHLETQERRSMEPRLMQLLCLLASQTGSVQTRDHLIQTIWPKVIVNENSLTRAVSELRKKLSHSSHPQCLIETIPKTGYRLTAPCLPATESIKVTPQASVKTIIDEPLTTNGWRAGLTGLTAIRQSMAAGAFALIAFVAFGTLNYSVDKEIPANPQRPLADINISGADALSSLIGARMDTVVSNTGATGITQARISNSEGTQAIVSRDGRLFAQIRYSEEGSSLLLGSTDLPNSPVTVLNTQDFLYNLQWSPIDRALLFAQSPRVTNAALQQQEQTSLVMFDIDSFSTKVIQGPATTPNDDEVLAKPHNFKLTNLSSHFDWFS